MAVVVHLQPVHDLAKVAVHVQPKQGRSLNKHLQSNSSLPDYVAMHPNASAQCQPRDRSVCMQTTWQRNRHSTCARCKSSR